MKKLFAVFGALALMLVFSVNGYASTLEPSYVTVKQVNGTYDYTEPNYSYDVYIDWVDIADSDSYTVYVNGVSVGTPTLSNFTYTHTGADMTIVNIEVSNTFSASESTKYVYGNFTGNSEGLDSWLAVLGGVFATMLTFFSGVYAVIMAEPILVVPFGIILTMTVIALSKRVV